MLFGGYFGNSLVVAPEHDVIGRLKEGWHGPLQFVLHGFTTPTFWLAVAGIAAAWYCYLVNPSLPARVRERAGAIYALLDNKYYFDRINEIVFGAGSVRLGRFLSQVGDRALIDGIMVNGTARLVGWASALLRHIQSGYVYHYAFTMIVGVFALLAWFNR
jgi:NADH-quinone oxidoreductase subunit L